jgi:hypothetical protein
METVSPFFIKGNRGPIIFAGNQFRMNIGTSGGAIFITEPDFRFENRPYIVMYDNTFSNNMAYFGGNAFSINLHMTMLNITDQ